MAQTTVDIDGDFSVTSNDSEAEIRAAFEPESPAPSAPAEPAAPPPDAAAAPATAPPPDAPPTTDTDRKFDGRTREGRRQSIQRQIDDDVARRHAAKRDADAEEQRLRTLRAEADRLTTARAASPADGTAAAGSPSSPAAVPTSDLSAQELDRFLTMPGAPNIEHYNDIAAYQFAVSIFVSNKVAEERFNQLMQAQAHAQTVRARNQGFQARVENETKKDPTFPDKLKATPVDTRVVPWLHAHPQGEDIMMHLVNHPDLAQAITDLHPIDQIGRMGEIAGELKARTAAATSGPARTPNISHAKAPIKPLGTAPAVNEDVDEADLPIEQFISRGNARDRAAGRY